MTENDHGHGQASVKILILDADLNEHPVTTNDHTLTGRQIVLLAGAHPPDEQVVLYRGQSSGLVDLSEDDTVEVANASTFWVIQSDRLFRFEVDGVDFVWPIALTTGRILYAIARVDIEKQQLMLERGDQPDLELASDTIINLDEQGLERFQTKPRPPRGHRIFINDLAHTVLQDALSGAQIMALGEIDSDYQLFLEQPGDDRPIEPTVSVKIEEGLRFYSLPKATFG